MRNENFMSLTLKRVSVALEENKLIWEYFSTIKSSGIILLIYVAAFAIKLYQNLLPYEFLLKEIFIYLAGELLFFAALYKLYLKSIEYIKKNKITPFAAIKKLSVISVLLLMILLIGIVYQGEWIGFLTEVSKFIFGFLSIFLISFIFSFYEYFAIAGRQKDGLFYFRVSLWFGVFYCFADLFVDRIGDFISSAFLTVYIITIIINSLRSTWIGYLPKKEKIQNLYFSVLLIIIFSLILSQAEEVNFLFKILFEESRLFKPIFLALSLYGILYFSFAFIITLFNLPTSAAYERKNKEVNSLIYLNKLLSQTTDLEELYKSITTLSLEVFDADVAFLLVKKNGEKNTVSCKNIDYKISEEISRILLKNNNIYKIDKKIYKGKTGANIEVELMELDNLKGEGWIIPRALAAKFGDFNKEFGFLFIARLTEDSFYKEDINFLEAFADYAWIALENANLLKVAIENEKYEKELALAREIQKKLLPDKMPSYRELDISAAFVPAFNVGGDYYDFFEVEDSKLAFVIADVSGKGISAAFIMAQAEGIFEGLLKNFSDPLKILTNANNILHKNLTRKNFVTAALGIIDLKNSNMIFSRAGHTPLILVRNGKANYLKPKGIGLGIANKTTFEKNIEAVEIKLEENDALILFTDGIIEARNSLGEEFGLERLISIAENYAWNNSDELRSMILKSVFAFCEGESQFDDLTLLIIKIKELNR